MIPVLIPVSYTHLDVYKRQRQSVAWKNPVLRFDAPEGMRIARWVYMPEDFELGEADWADENGKITDGRKQPVSVLKQECGTTGFVPVSYTHLIKTDASGKLIFSVDDKVWSSTDYPLIHIKNVSVEVSNYGSWKEDQATDVYKRQVL